MTLDISVVVQLMSLYVRDAGIGELV